MNSALSLDTVFEPVVADEEGPNFFLVGGPNPAYCRKKNMTTVKMQES